MLQLSDGRIMVSPQGGSLQIISLSNNDVAEQPIISNLQVPGNRKIHGIGRDDKGFIWVGCTDKSIFIYTPTTSRFDMLSDGHTFTSLIEKVGGILNTRSGHESILNLYPRERINFQDSTGALYPNLITWGLDGQPIIANRFPLNTNSAGALYFDYSGLKTGDLLNKVPPFSLQSLVPGQSIKCLLLDKSGIMWIGTMGHGLYKFRLGSNYFHQYLSKVSLQRITVLNNDQLYLQGWRSLHATNADGRPVDINFLPRTKTVTAPLLQVKNGDYWTYLIEEKTLLRYNNQLQLLASYPEPVNPILTEQIQPLIEDSRHRIWVCGANGSLACVDPATGKMSKYVIDLEQTSGSTTIVQTNAFYEDGKGIFWLATEHGFASIAFLREATRPKVKWYKNIPGNSNSLSYNNVSWFMDDPAYEDFLWVCTKGGGLNRMEKSTDHFVHFTTKQGLPNDVVYGILTDKEGNIWGSTNKGLFCLLSQKKDETPIFRVFSVRDGLQADEFNTNAFAKLSDGNLAFGGVNGLNIFNPKSVLQSGFSPNVFITTILIGNEEILPNDKTGILQQTIEKTSAITLNHLQDILTLEFSSLDFTSPNQNKYRYQLVGIDKTWVESGTRRTATYLHLPAGNYVLRVQGTNSQGVWSNKIKELQIKVLPPWWRTWWAYLIYVLLTGFAIRAYFLFRINKAKLQSQLHYEQQEAKRIKELDAVKTQLYANITHEFRTPLTVILGMASQVKNDPNKHLQTGVDMIVRNGENLLNLVNEMLDLSKLEDGKMTLHLVKNDLIHFLRYVVESFQSLAVSQQKQFHFLADADELIVAYDAEKLRQIITNLLSNALKFTPAQGNVYVSISDEDAEDVGYRIIVIKVKDTGIGIPEKQLQHIFDRFYQLDNSHTRKAEGTGIGLALTKELVKLMNGTITVKSPALGATKGTEFIIKLPLQKAILEGPALLVPAFTKEPVTISDSVRIDPFIISNEHNPSATPLILLVEDNVDVVAYTASCLPQYKLAVGKDGKEGIDIAVELIPDLIITDVMMPLIDGFEMCRKLRQDERTSHIPIIMLTAKADMQSKLEGLEKGADVYLEKPFYKEELLLRIKKLLELRKNLQQYYSKQIGIVQHSESALADEIISAGVEEPAEHEFVKKVREIVEANFTNYEFSVEHLCKLILMSHSQLHRKLEALTGCPPNKFIRIIRLNKAKELLTIPSLSIAFIAMECGYNDPGYFARVFKQVYGVAPQEWRVGK
ncbi:MAG: ATP-binding protein [Saprospiraceae bacterium]